MTFDMKYGRRAPKRTPSLKLASFLKAIPDHPISEDYLSQLTGWKILANDQYGDCACVEWSNHRRLVTTLLGGKEEYPNLNEVLKLYKTQNPNFPQDDGGMNVQTMLENLNHNGGPDGVKLTAFASVDTSNLEEVKAALAIFGGLLLGIEVQDLNQQDFANGVPWDYHSDGTVEGGHAVLAAGYDPDSIKFITWGAETEMTSNFWKNLVNCPSGECWCLIWPENLGTKQFIDGINMDVLASDYEALTGRPFPVGENPPSPIVNPDPSNNNGCTAAILKLFGIG
jgi:hypothetical protein